MALPSAKVESSAPPQCRSRCEERCKRCEEGCEENRNLPPWIIADGGTATAHANAAQRHRRSRKLRFYLHESGAFNFSSVAVRTALSQSSRTLRNLGASE